MTHKELTAQLEEMKDDPGAWGEPEPEPEPGRRRKSERRQRGALVSVRFTPEELAVVQAHAAAAGTSVSGYLRDVALTARQPVATGWINAASTVNGSATRELFLVRKDTIFAADLTAR